MQKFEELKALVASVEPEVIKFYEKGNSAAGTRLRKGMQEIKAKCSEIRNEVSDKKKSDK